METNVKQNVQIEKDGISWICTSILLLNLSCPFNRKCTGMKDERNIIHPSVNPITLQCQLGWHHLEKKKKKSWLQANEFWVCIFFCIFPSFLILDTLNHLLIISHAKDFLKQQKNHLSISTWKGVKIVRQTCRPNRKGVTGCGQRQS